jgi:hypothetical protein
MAAGMSTKKIIIAVILLAVIAGGMYAWREYTRPVKGLDSVDADYTVQATVLLQEFMTNETTANQKYLNKIVAVSGLVKDVDTTGGSWIIVLGDTADMSSVRCIMNPVNNAEAPLAAVQKGAAITVKGAVTGFKKDETGLLGSDVELNRGVRE